jgi:hypothetical protein
VLTHDVRIAAFADNGEYDSLFSRLDSNVVHASHKNGVDTNLRPDEVGILTVIYR